MAHELFGELRKFVQDHREEIRKEASVDRENKDLGRILGLNGMQKKEDNIQRVPSLKDQCILAVAGDVSGIGREFWVEKKRMMPLGKKQIPTPLPVTMDLLNDILIAAAVEKKLTDEALRYLLHPRMTKISLEQVKITDKSMDLIADCCPDLETLMIGKAFQMHRPAKLTTKGIQTILQSCSHLKHLDISFWPDLNDSTMRALLPYFPDGLETLKLQANKGLTQDGLLLLKKFKHLKVLDLRWCSVITDDTLEILLSEIGQELRSLNVGWCSSITDKGIAIIAEKCPKLEILSLEMVTNVTDAIFKHLSEYTPELQILSVRNCALVSCTSEHVEAFFRNCPKIRSLDFSGCRHLTERVVNFYLPKYSPNLEVLYCRSCFSLTTDDVWKMITDCTHLAKLDIANCHAVCPTELTLRLKRARNARLSVNSYPLSLGFLSAKRCKAFAM